MYSFIRRSSRLRTQYSPIKHTIKNIPNYTHINNIKISCISNDHTHPPKTKYYYHHHNHTTNFHSSAILRAGAYINPGHAVLPPLNPIFAKDNTDPQERVRELFGELDPNDLVEVVVNNKRVAVPSGVTILQACEAAGVNIPRFCYHDRLSIAGNCRMCLVEVEKAKKPVASCANPIMPGMIIKTTTDMVKFAREGVVELLLANHPLDCPICDQGGECDLQDITITFGSLQGRYRENRRAVEDKNLGPFVKTVMNRCIHCTRCVRFADEITGNECLGTTGRGNATEIGTYIESFFDSEISGNVIDLCPVGALTNKPSAFKVRPWDLTVVESIDVLESTCANIVLDTRFNELIRVKPRLNEDVNEEWISDKTRFCVDGLKRQRLDMPLVRDGESGQLMPSTWPEALDVIAKVIGDTDPNLIKAFCGDLVDIESALALKDFLNHLGCNNTECRLDGTRMECDIRSNYLFNSSIPGIDYSDCCLLVGTNPRMEAPLINARLRKAFLNGLDIHLIGNNAYLNYDKTVLGENLSTLEAIASNSISSDPNIESFKEMLADAQYPMIIFGMSSLTAEHYASTMSLIDVLIKKYPNLMDTENDWNGISFLQTRSGRNGALDIGFVPGPPSFSTSAEQKVSSDDRDMEVFYLLQADDYCHLDSIPESAFVIYQGSHGERGAKIADVILPGCSFIEQSGTYVNVDGRVQKTKAALTSPGQSRADWQIIRALAELCAVDLPYSTADELHERMIDIAPHLAKMEDIEKPVWSDRELRVESVDAVAICNREFEKYFTNYFATDAISRSSVTLRKASRQLKYSTNSWV